MSETLLTDRIPLDEYTGLLGEAEIGELRALARPLTNREVCMVNTTAVGGGVAEILNRLATSSVRSPIARVWAMRRSRGRIL